MLKLPPVLVTAELQGGFRGSVGINQKRFSDMFIIMKQISLIFIVLVTERNSFALICVGYFSASALVLSCHEILKYSCALTFESACVSVAGKLDHFC